MHTARSLTVHASVDVHTMGWGLGPCTVRSHAGVGERDGLYSEVQCIWVMVTWDPLPLPDTIENITFQQLRL